VLLGRDAELAVLNALITQAEAGTGGVVLLTGEPGVGKTRLARASTEHAVGTMVSWGACAAQPPGASISETMTHRGGKP
jgi:dephospho-CoA kinase